MRKINLGIIIPTLYKGGAERIASTLSLNFPKNINVYFILFDKKVTYQYSGVLESINIPISSNIIKEAINMLIRPIKISAIANKYKIDLLLSFDETANFASILSGIKTIASIHRSIAFADKEKSKVKLFFAKMLRFLYKFACRIIVPSKELSEEIKHYVPKDKVITIYNPHDIDGIIKLSKEKITLKLPKEYILNVGRLEKEKGQWHLLRAFKIVRKQYPNIKLVILGSGSLEKELRSIAKKIGILDSVVFLDQWVENPYDIMKDAKLFVLSSIYEGFPNVLIESLAVKTPIVASSFKAGASEILGKKLKKEKTFWICERGILTEPLSNKFLITEPLTKAEKSLADGIIYALSHNLNEQKENGFNFVKELKVDKIIKEYIKLIEECTKFKIKEK